MRSPTAHESLTVLMGYRIKTHDCSPSKLTDISTDISEMHISKQLFFDKHLECRYNLNKLKLESVCKKY